MTKQARQHAIRDIIGTIAIGRQDDLVHQLKHRGFRVTQATLSRDMKELGVVRTVDGGGARYSMQSASEAQILRPIVGVEVVAIDANEYLIAIRTLPGCANTVAEFIDVLQHPDIMGTVAGDNTILVIPTSIRKTKNLMVFLKNKLIEGR